MRKKIQKTIEKIDSLCGDLSVGGFPKEALKIRMILDKIVNIHICITIEEMPKNKE